MTRMTQRRVEIRTSRSVTLARSRTGELETTTRVPYLAASGMTMTLYEKYIIRMQASSEAPSSVVRML